MNSIEQQQFLRDFSQMVLLYPGTPVGAPNGAAYLAHLNDLPYDAVHEALVLAMGRSETFFPTEPSVRSLALERAAVHAKDRAWSQKSLLPPATVNRDQILQDFYRSCDAAEVTRIGIDDNAEVVLSGLVALMTRYYHTQCRPEDENCAELAHRPACDFNARVFVSAFKQRKFNASQCVVGLRRAMAMFALAPTIGAIESFIRNQPIGSTFDDWLRVKPSTTAPTGAQPGE